MKQTLPERFRISFSTGLYFYLALLILLVPLRWLLAAAVSVTVHELFHIAAIRCFGIPIHSVRIGIDGAKIRTQPMLLWQELICALAGPFGGLLLLPLARWFPVTALCSGFHSLYNLLPVYPQDGGRALRCGARLLITDKWASRICTAAEYICLAGVGALGVYGTFVLKAGILPLLFAAFFLRRSYRMKISLQREERRGTI